MKMVHKLRKGYGAVMQSRPNNAMFVACSMEFWCTFKKAEESQQEAVTSLGRKKNLCDAVPAVSIRPGFLTLIKHLCQVILACKMGVMVANSKVKKM